MKEFFSTVFYEPVYNGFVFLLSVVPGTDVGVAVIALTIAVKFLILPLSHKSIKSQAQMRKIEPEVKKIKEAYGKDKQEQSKRVMELYKKHGVNPFSGCFLVFIQLPVILALYWVFFKGLTNPNPDILYSFITMPETINTKFLGIVEMLGKNLPLAVLAGITQYYQMKLSLPPRVNTDKQSNRASFKEEFAKNMNVQMRYVLPIFVAFVAYTISAAVALYWVTNNLFSIIHELLVRRKATELIGERR